ncbi:uncharacterized protein APUU_61042A [Aspergillus puulaauensis]|uniref:Uncharacterized protein n=1 Tax=Aspergillus puulaauensis TaxID=1220207 RepID=A0A7R7XV21_9EURO|nr:uncharacterized protein APUU_61042A [Aspergillus puulaauensis]BCS27994.1 hypothetical protein APUU_61042A [Aspergillus puulaauensis]
MIRDILSMEKESLTDRIMIGGRDNQSTPEQLKNCLSCITHVWPQTSGWIGIATPHRIPDPITFVVGDVPMQRSFAIGACNSTLIILEYSAILVSYSKRMACFLQSLCLATTQVPCH